MQNPVEGYDLAEASKDTGTELPKTFVAWCDATEAADSSGDMEEVRIPLGDFRVFQHLVAAAA